MPIRTRCAFSLLAALLISCGDDSTAPPDETPAPVSRMIGSVGENTNALALAVTSDRLRVVAGTFGGTLHVSGLSDSLVATGESDVFLIAFREDGTLAWTRAIGGDGFSLPRSIARDASNNIYIAGSYSGSNPAFGTIDLPQYGSWDVLLAKLSPTGIPVWAVGGGAVGEDIAYDVAVAPDGGAFVCGVASSEIYVAGEDMGEFGSSSGFLAKINASGSGGWTATASGTGQAYCLTLARAGDGGVIVCGNYAGSTVEIGGEILPLDGERGGFISRFSESGVAGGNIRIGGTGSSSLYGLTEIDGDPVAVGTFSGTVDFDVITAGGEKTSIGGIDAFVARYSRGGALRWVRTYGTADEEIAMSVSRLGSSDLLLAGLFESYITLGSTTLPTNGTNDIFIARLDGSGNVRWADRLGGPNYEISVEVASVGSTAIVLGQGWGEIRFPDGTKRSSFGTLDAFLYQKP